MSADVFISYIRADAARVGKIAEALRAAGFSVWMDSDLPSGAFFDTEIAKELHGARAVLVCWSQSACASEWVRGEAAAAGAKAVHVTLEACAPPVAGAIDLRDWSGGRAHPAMRRLLAGLAAKTGHAYVAARARGRGRLAAALGGAALAAAAAAVAWGALASKAPAPTPTASSAAHGAN